MEYFVGLLIGYIIDGIIFGLITQHVAESKGYTSGFAWGFWLGLIGLLVVGFRPNLTTAAPAEYKPMYPNAQPKPKEQWECSCGARNPVTLNYCLSCRRERGSIQPIIRVSCPHCGAQNKDTNTTCFACGKLLKETAPLPGTPAAVQTTTGYVELLEKLTKLHTEGVLADDEYNAKKAEIIAKL